MNTATQYVNTLSGLIYEVTCLSERGHLIKALHQHDPNVFPLNRTRVDHIEGPNWFAHVSDSDPLIRFHSASRYSLTTSHIFEISPECYEDGHIESPTPLQLEWFSDGLPYLLTIHRFPEDDGTMGYSIDHSFPGNFMRGCSDGEHHDHSDLLHQLTHCRHRVQANGTCQQLKKEVILDIMRLYDIVRAS